VGCGGASSASTEAPSARVAQLRAAPGLDTAGEAGGDQGGKHGPDAAKAAGADQEAYEAALYEESHLSPAVRPLRCGSWVRCGT
jgi:hypothetical protein